MASVRIEFVTVGQSKNAISQILLAQDITVSGVAAPSSAAPAGTQAVRVTAIGGAAYVNQRETVTPTKSIRLSDGQTEIVATVAGKTVSVMAATT